MPIRTIPIRNDFLITGHGRSGTHYMAALFTALGFPVGQKWYGEFGMSHHFPFRLIPWPYSDWEKRYLHLIHYVRNPRKVVESTYLYEDECGSDIVEENATKIGEINTGNRIDRTIRSVVLWNRAIGSARPELTVRVEDAPSACRTWLESNGYKTKRGELPPTTTNSGPEHGDRVPWHDAGSESMEMLNEHCAIYGYPTEEVECSGQS